MGVVIIHGTKASPESNWFQWLKQQIGDAVVPRFPTPQGENLENWLKVLDEYDIDENTVLVGHSIGPAFILQKLQRMNKPVKGIVLVSGFVGEIGIPDYDELNKTFFENLDWEKAKANAGKITVIYGANDPYVPLNMLESVAKNLGVEPIVIQDGKHLNSEAGYTEFPEVLKILRIILQPQ